MSRGQMSLLAFKRPADNCHLWSNVPRSNVTCGQMSRSQMSLRSNVLWSNVTCVQMSRGQISRSQMSLAVKCPTVESQLRSNVITPLGVKCPLWFIVLWSNVRGQTSRGQMIPWS